MRIAVFVSVALSLCLWVVPHCENGRIIKQWEFEEDTGNWSTIDPEGEIRRTEAEGTVFAGEGALELAYRQRTPASADDERQSEQKEKDTEGEEKGKQKEEGFPGAAIVPLEVSLEGLSDISFAVGTTYSLPLSVALREEDESSYNATVWSGAGQWNEVELQLDDFILEDDSLDENDKLDVDQVRTLAIVDLSVFGRALQEQGLPFRGPPPRDIRLFLDNVQLRAVSASEKQEKGDIGQAPEQKEDDSADAAGGDDERVTIDNCNSSTIQWLPLGGQELSMTVQGADETDRHLQVKFVAQPGSIFALMRGMRAGTLAGCKAIVFDRKVEFSRMMVASLQMEGGGRFFKPLEKAKAGEWQTVKIMMSEFQPDKNSGASSPVDPAKIKDFGLADISAIAENTISANTWHIRNVYAVCTETDIEEGKK